MAKEFNGAVADQPENLRHPMCRILRPGSKSRRILIEDVRAVEPFLALRAEAHETKLVVILEADRMMDEPANAFLKTLEEPPEYAVFILATTELRRLPVTVLSRCQRFDFKSISENDIVERLKVVCSELGREAEEEALVEIARASGGAMRDDPRDLLCKRRCG